MVTAIHHSVPEWVKPPFVILTSVHWRSGLIVRVPGCQKLQMTTTRSDTGCFIAVTIWQQWASKG